MALNSELKDGSDLYVKYGCVDASVDDNGLRQLFDQVLSFFLKEVSVNKNVFRPFPPKLGDGVEADLFKVFLAVKRLGSYEIVSQNNLWEFVAKECGFEIGLEGSLKLLYVKYLKELDQWLIKGGFKDEKIENVDMDVIEKLDLLSHLLDEIDGFKDEGTLGFDQNEGIVNLDVPFFNDDDEKFRVGDDKRCELSSENAVKKVGVSVMNDEVKRNELSRENVVEKVGLSVINIDDDDDDNDDVEELSSENFVKKVGVSMINDEVKRNKFSPENVEKVGLSVINIDDDDDDDDDNNDNDDVEELSVGDEKQIGSSIKIVANEINRVHSNNNVTLTAPNSHDVSNVEKRVSLKRKRGKESLLLSEMIDWVANAARNPHDMIYKTSQRSLKWKKYTGDKLWKQALLSRRALFAEFKFDSGIEAKGSQKKNQRMMHPAMYEDDNRIYSEGKRCCRSATSAEQCTCTSCNLRTSSRMKRPRTENGKFQIQETGNPHNQNYNLGPLYQAVVPAWTGVVSESDSKWLGTQMWPQPDDINEEHEKGSLVIGLGRQDYCECLFSGSAECVRFHIAENRYKLKLEIGDLFYKWKFNQMGEEVSLSWEPEEEKIFKSLVIKARHDLAHSSKSRHEIMNKFWKRGAYIIRDKTKQKLVSYYFNVFVLRRRSYQNRVTPKDIDSDNDEEEVGSVGDRFGYEKIHGLLLKCSENMQCRDLES